MSNDSPEATISFLRSLAKDALADGLKEKAGILTLATELIAAQSRHEAEREALIRKCAGICWNNRQYFAGKWSIASSARDEILTLLDSGSQG
jgi:hypothetical protein